MHKPFVTVEFEEKGAWRKRSSLPQSINGPPGLGVKAKPGRGHFHLERAETCRRIAPEFGRGRHAPQDRSVPFGDVDTGVLYQAILKKFLPEWKRGERFALDGL